MHSAETSCIQLFALGSAAPETVDFLIKQPLKARFPSRQGIAKENGCRQDAERGEKGRSEEKSAD